MRNLVSKYVDRFRYEHRVRFQLLTIVLVLAVVVAGVVFWQLRYVGVAMANEYSCGYGEHTHDDSCYALELTCEEETKGLAEHTHDESCYETVQTLICDLEESEGKDGHIHDDSCYTAEGVQICDLEEADREDGHTHDDSCYATEEVLICGLEETGATHVHDDSCYESVLVCEIPEHVHSVECLIDGDVDLETAKDWEATLPDEIPENWAEAVVAVAESQVGYTESEKNFQVGEDGETRNGYTRYGAWYGNPYGDWDAMFASFCLYYADVPEEDFPQAAGVWAWITELSKMELYAESADYEPVPGDLVFFDTDGDSKADTVAILTAVDENELTVVQGDSHDAVEEYTVRFDDDSVVGYGLLPEENDGIMPLMDGTGSTFPVNTIYKLFVVWMTSGTGETVYSWTRDNHVTSENNSDQGTIDALASGSYRIRIDFEDLRSDQDLQVGQSYVLALDWPTGDGVTVTPRSTSGTIRNSSGTDLATWQLNPETGEITITILARTDDDNFCIEFTVTVTNENEPEPGGDGDIATGSIKKDGVIDELVDDTITYTITAIVPRYTESANGGKAYVWSVDDKMQASIVYGGDYNNDMSDVEIVMTSSQYPGGIVIPSVENATEADAYAYYVKVDNDKEDEIIFLNRCSCEETNCADWSDGCGNLYDDTGFCSCWLSVYNATFTITYSVDISEIIQGMEDRANASAYTQIMNSAYLYNGGDYPVDNNSDQEYVYRPFSKSETTNPDRNTENKGVGSYKIEISEHGVDYSWADDIEVTDVMDNLALVEDSLTVTVGDTVLTLIDEEEAAGLDKETDHDKYYSYTYTDVTENGEVTGGTLVIKIWYPTNQDITIEYQASVISYNTSPTGDYSNSVTIGKTGYTLNGSYQEGSSGQGGSGLTCSMTLTKVDAEDNEVVLPGAVFEIYRHVEDGDDILVDTLTTGEDGTFTFASNDNEGYWMDRDVLYYVKEIEAPAGYIPDTTLYGFVFLRNGYEGTYPDVLDPTNVILGEPDGDQIHIEITVENAKTSTYPVDIYKYTGDDVTITYTGTASELTESQYYLWRVSDTDSTKELATGSPEGSDGVFHITAWSDGTGSGHPLHDAFQPVDGQLKFTGLENGYTYYLMTSATDFDKSSAIKLTLAPESVSGGTALSGAEFIVSQVNGDTTYYGVFTQGSDGVWYLSAWTEDETEATALTTGSDGHLYVDGLVAGTYSLIETKAPHGYVLLDKPISFTLGDVPVTGIAIPVANIASEELPNTGGIGTWIYIAFGLLLISGAAVLLIKRRGVRV